jgi:hypothetical protein
MRCSECSEIVKPIVAIDIDGTLGDYHGHLIAFMQAYLGVENRLHSTELYDGDGKMSAWSNRTYGIDHKTYEQIKLAYRQGAQKRSMPAYRGIDEITTATIGAEFWVTTTRPFLRLDGVDPDTRFWLDKHNIKFDGLLYDEDKYRVLAERVDPERVVAVLDDLPEQYDAAAQAFGDQVPILRTQPYNRAVTRPYMAPSLGYAAAMIHSRLMMWEEEYGERTRH